VGPPGKVVCEGRELTPRPPGPLDKSEGVVNRVRPFSRVASLVRGPSSISCGSGHDSRLAVCRYDALIPRALDFSPGHPGVAVHAPEAHPPGRILRAGHRRDTATADADRRLVYRALHSML